jgi:plastocyanin
MLAIQAVRRLAADAKEVPSLTVVPDVITVPDGTKVTLTNDDNFTHCLRLTDDGGEVMVMKPGESASFTFHGVGRAPLRLLVPLAADERRGDRHR